MTKYILILMLSGFHPTNIKVKKYNSYDDCVEAGKLAMEAEWEPPFDKPIKSVMKFSCVKIVDKH